MSDYITKSRYPLRAPHVDALAGVLNAWLVMLHEGGGWVVSSATHVAAIFQELERRRLSEKSAQAGIAAWEEADAGSTACSGMQVQTVLVAQ